MYILQITVSKQTAQSYDQNLPDGHENNGIDNAILQLYILSNLDLLA